MSTARQEALLEYSSLGSDLHCPLGFYVFPTDPFSELRYTRARSVNSLTSLLMDSLEGSRLHTQRVLCWSRATLHTRHPIHLSLCAARALAADALLPSARGSCYKSSADRQSFPTMAPSCRLSLSRLALPEGEFFLSLNSRRSR